MIEILKAIALLCVLGPDRPIDTIEEAQLRCQKHYIRCVKAKRPITTAQKADALAKCILEKK